MLPYLLAFATLGLFVVLFVREPKLGTYIKFVFLLLPFMDLKLMPDYFGGLRTFDFITYAMPIVLYKDFFSIDSSKLKKAYPFLIILFLGTVFLGKLYSGGIAEKYHLLVQVLPVFIFARLLGVYIQGRTWGDNVDIFRWLRMGFCIALFFVAMQLMVGLDFSYYSSLNGNTFDPDSGTIRYPGVFHDSQKHGQFLALFSFALLIPNDFWKLKSPWGNRLLFLCTSLAILLTGSRSALAGFILGCLILFILGGSKIRAFFMAIAGVGILVLLLYAPQMTIFERSANISEDYLFRRAIWEETIDIAGDHPVLGIGLGNFEKYVTIYNQDLYLQNGEGEIIYLDQPENGYLKLLVEHGYVGMFLFVMIVLVPIVSGLIALNKNSKIGYVAFLISGVLSWVLAFNTVYSLTDNRLLVLLCTNLVLLYFAGNTVEPSHKWSDESRSDLGKIIGNV